jgi:biotin/methionine sulfoxide reductase
VLPATTSLERNDIGCARRDPFIIAMQQAVAPIGQARNDFDIFKDLAKRLGCAEAFTQGRDEMGWLQHLYEKSRVAAATNAMPDFDTFWQDGWFEISAAADEYVLFGEFRSDPAKHPLRTPSGKIELYSDRIAGFGYEDCPPHPTWIEPAEWLGAEMAARYPLHLVSSQPRDRLHSQMDPGPVSLGGKVAGREAIAMHPDDAKTRGLADGDVVRVFNTRGACLAGVIVSDAVRPGVVRLSCGAWYDPVDHSDDALCLHGNANVLTRDHGTSQLGQGPSSATTLVEVERWSGAVPPVRAFEPPAMVAAE